MSSRNRLLRSRMIKGVLYVWTYNLKGEIVTHILIKGSAVKVMKGEVVK